MNLNKRKDGGFILMASLVMMLFLSIMLGAAMMRSGMQQARAIQRRAVQEAFYSAESGVEQAIFELRRNSQWGLAQAGSNVISDVRLNRVSGDDTTTIGFYSVEVADGGLFNGFNTRWIKSVGDDSVKSLQKIVVVRVLVENPARFLFSTLGDLRVGSGATINAEFLGKDIYFDVNEALGSPGMNININGDANYIASVNGETHPAVIIGNGAQVQQFPTITFAGVDLTRYRDIAQQLQTIGEGIYVGGDYPVDFSTIVNDNGGIPPQIIFAEGDITVIGEYTDSMLVVAGNNIYINGDTMPDSNLAAPDIPQIGLLAKDDVIIPETVSTSGGDLSIEAFIMAEGAGPGAEGIFKAEGPKSTQGTLNFKGAVAVKGGGRSAVDLNVFIPRNYDFNPELTSNRKIPFSPFIANILEWYELNLNDPFPPS